MNNLLIYKVDLNESYLFPSERTVFSDFRTDDRGGSPSGCLAGTRKLRRQPLLQELDLGYFSQTALLTVKDYLAQTLGSDQKKGCPYSFQCFASVLFARNLIYFM